VVTFTLTGFNKREGVELMGTFTASINTEMKVGTLEETIVVSGESPIVDVQSVRPTNLDIQVTPGVVFFGGAGGRNNEGRIRVDGLTTTAALNGGARPATYPTLATRRKSL
jgi:hypothetical protein